MSDALDTKFGELDMAKKTDRRMLIRAVKGRWPIGDDLRELAIQKLQGSLEHCAVSEAREIASLLRVAAAFEAQNQADEHLLEKQDRADDGKADQIVEIVVKRENQIGER